MSQLCTMTGLGSCKNGHNDTHDKEIQLEMIVKINGDG